MRSFLLFASALPACVVATGAHACRPQFTSHSQTVNVNGVAMGAGNVAVERFSVGVRNADGDQCPTQLRISRAAPGDPATPLYVLLSNSQQISIAPNEQTATSSSDIGITAGAGSSGSLSPFELRLPTEWGLKAGDYDEPLLMSLIGPDGAVLDRLNLNVHIIIPAAVALNLVGATGGGAGPAQINLGLLSSTQQVRSPPFGARVWSTSPYNIAFRSENHGALAQSDGTDTIPYQLTMDNRPVDLSGGAAHFIFVRHTSSQGDSHPMSILVMPVRALAGHYSDRVTVSITAM